MKAFQLVGWQKPPEIREIPVPEPGPGEVLLKIGGAGACHSDLHLMEAPEGSASVTFPFTLGHENAGWVEKLGPGAAGYAVGDPVLVYGPWGCGRCLNCRMGLENYCENEGVERPGGLGRNGGMANYLVVPSTRFLIPIGDLDPREAAPLSDAALTSYHAVKRSLHLLGAGSTAVVIGAGGLGQMAIQLLRVLSAATMIVAMDTAPDKLATAKQMGADEALVSGPDAVRRIRDMTFGHGASLVLDMVGIDPTLKIAAQVARSLGHVTIVGLGGGTLPVNFFSLPHECSAMRKPFLDDCRVVVVLFREPWGKTPWTRVEQTAIQDGCLAQGWHRLFFLTLDKASQLPIWLPHTHVRFNYEDFGLEQAVGAIKARVQECGGVIEPMTALKRATLYEQESQYQMERKLINSYQGMEIFIEKFKDLMTEIHRICAQIIDSGNKSLMLGANEGRCVIRNNLVSLAVGWYQSYSNTIDGCGLKVAEFNAQIPLPNMREMSFSEPTKLSETTFLPELSRAREYGWSSAE